MNEQSNSQTNTTETKPLDLSTMSEADVTSYIVGLGYPRFRGAQVYGWLQKGATYDEMVNVPAEIRERLKRTVSSSNAGLLKIKARLVSEIDGTHKYLFDLGDGNFIESVLMKYKYGYSVCVSTQVGCKMGCSFCASTIAGFKRNLTSGEILSQILTINKDLGIQIGHIVLMGIGEPMDNYDNVIAFLKKAHSEDGLNISYRHMSLSTCGVVPGIEKLLKEDLPITLSVSLHNPFQDERAEIMPVAKAYNLDKLLEICNIYTKVTKRRITFEYALIAGVNDSDRHAKELIRRLKPMGAHINLIPVNSVSGTGYKRGTKEAIDSFKDALIAGGVNATVRRAMGRDIEAACGQLRRQAIEEEK